MLAPICPTKHHQVMDPDILACKRFCFAILERAVLDIVCTKGVERHHKQAARTWILQNYIEPFSFAWICELLDLNHLELRDKIFVTELDRYKPCSKSAVRNFVDREPAYLDAIEVHTWTAKAR